MGPGLGPGSRGSKAGGPTYDIGSALPMTDEPLANVLGQACAISVRSAIVPGHVGPFRVCPWVQDCCAISLVWLIALSLAAFFDARTCADVRYGHTCHE